MADILLNEEVRDLLKKREFINVATCDFDHTPNVAPKFLLKVEDNCVYLADYIIGRTWRNLKINPHASLSTININNIVAYQLNGTVEIIEKGTQFKKLLKELNDKLVDFSTKRIIEGIRANRPHQHTELSFPDRVVIFKITIEEIVRIGPQGTLERKKIRS
jgi:predicted pyridoxine 5'-phosphate oxidase superfamily flavin-nucleotide-binding protein